MNDDSGLVSHGLLRHYSHLLAETSSVKETIEKLEGIKHPEFDHALNQYQNVEEYTHSISEQAGLLIHIRNALPQDEVEDRLLILHYRAAVERVEQQSNLYRGLFRGRLLYLVADGT